MNLYLKKNTFTFIGEQIEKHKTTVAQEILNHRLENRNLLMIHINSAPYLEIQRFIDEELLHIRKKDKL